MRSIISKLMATLVCPLLVSQLAAVEDLWRYTTTNPGQGWEQPDAQQSQQWKTGKAGFGTLYQHFRVSRTYTEWRVSDIWMRREYVLKEGQDADELSLEVCHDEDFEVYINGFLAAQSKGVAIAYKMYPIAADARRALKVGKNLIAVHCHQTAGGQFIDVGLTTKKEPYVPPNVEALVDAARPIVKEKYSRKATWQETMLAVRAGLRSSAVKVDMALSSALAFEFWRDFPHQTDWLMQGSAGAMSDWVAGYRDGKKDLMSFLQAQRGASLEQKLIEKVLPECASQTGTLEKELDALVAGGAPPEDGRWLDLYVKACQIRRQLRLRPLLEKTNQVIFARHHNMGGRDGGGNFFAYTEYTYWGENMFGGLCRLDLDNEAKADGKFATVTELIKTDTGGIVRDPALSYDARRLLFAWRKDSRDKYYKIYEMELANGNTRLITGANTYGASYDPCYLPGGDIIFASTRIVQSVDCAGPDVSNLFICDKDGRYARRVGFDQVHTLWPTVLDDGRVVYMRWDYNDRSQIYPQGLFQMNPDGSNQTEFYGNNTWQPNTLFHPCGIPGTSKVMVAMGGHHNPQCGKLGIVDTAKGRNGLVGIVELPSGEKPPYRREDQYAQTGDQYCYPFPLDESSLLVSYDPIGYHIRRKYRKTGFFETKGKMRFHLYFMTSDGRREVLSADVRVSSFEPIPVIPRKAPATRPSVLDYRKTTGVFYLQDVYHGPGLAGIPRGTIKKLRVVELRYRAMSIGANSTRGKGGAGAVITPIAIGSGTWDVKAILGDATVYEDGSAMFRVPARTPVYFQALNEKNQMIQTMRSWATLMPGERMSCVGCHEHKNQAPLSGRRASIAMKAGPETLAPFYGPVRGFSFPKEIQPILDKHCVKCHSKDGQARRHLLTAEPVLDTRSKRRWSRAYMTLLPFANWIHNSSEPCMIPPKYGGSTRSKLIAMHEEGHNDVKLSTEEMDKLCAWMDLAIPFCGDYMEANAWNEGELKRARERLTLRREMDEIDQKSIQEMLEATDNDNVKKLAKRALNMAK